MGAGEKRLIIPFSESFLLILSVAVAGVQTACVGLASWTKNFIGSYPTKD